MLTRRQLLKGGAMSAATVIASTHVWTAPAAAKRRRPLPALRRWVDPCPTPGAAWPVLDVRGVVAPAEAVLHVKEFDVTVHRDLPPTRVWGYEPAAGAAEGRSTYLGPTLLARRGTPATVTYVNQLPGTPLFPADPALVPHDAAACRINTHLHGGRIPAGEDGNPFDSYTGGSPEVERYGSRTHHYANEQGGALLWYHDHALGVTRTNVYAGLAGGYLLVEPPGSPDDASNVPTVFDASDVPDPYGDGFVPLHLPLVIQDKTFDGDGQLVYPAMWVPEFFGDTCLVNGKAFPFLDVQPRKYRFTFLNGSQSRFYNLRFNKPVPITQIGVELGYLEAPVSVRTILVGPGERADVIVDFAGVGIGTNLVLADTLLPPGVVSPTRPLGDCMQFRVVEPALSGGDPFAGPPVLPGWTSDSPTPRPGSPVDESKVTLEEVMGRGGKPVMAVVNGAPFMVRDDGVMTHECDEPFSTEVVTNGTTVDWLYLNLTADSHPFHTHLAHFEVISRQPFDAVAYEMALHQARAEVGADDRLDPADYPDLETYTFGPPVDAPPREKGPKDTVLANPGEVTRIRLRFDVPGAAADEEQRYVYHCHILEHEENEMMRPLVVRPAGD